MSQQSRKIGISHLQPAPLLAAQASSKRKNPPNAKDDLPPKKPKPEGYAQARMRVAGTLYGIYAGDTSDGDPLLDFKEFLDALPPQFWTFPGSMGFNDNRTIFPFILIAEGIYITLQFLVNISH